jgi:putative nucleotidyltransferase with HDIG domain
MDEQTLLKKIDTIKEIPTLPSIVFELNKYLQNPETSIKKVSETIEKDQAMALKILRLVNSAFYGFQSKISNVQNAVVLLGYNAVRNSVVSLSVIKSFSSVLALEGFDIKDFWRHSLAVAVTGKSLALLSRSESSDNCFAAGLLHDIGKIILAQYFQDLFEKVWLASKNEYSSFYKAEKNELPADHTKIGAHLATKWQLPKGLVDTIRWHHEYQSESENAGLIMIIYLANKIVNSYDEDPELRLDMTALHPDAVKFMMNLVEDVANWYVGLTEEIEQAYSFFLDAD